MVLLLINACGSLNPQQAKTKPVSHEAFTELLQQHVDEMGMVDYRGFMKDRDSLKAYLELLGKNAPNDSNWTEADQLAYWINVYNAYTIELILSYYPVASIKDIGRSVQVPFVNTPWDIKFIEIAGQKLNLNNIEHNILRKNWKEPRIHFAINCASLSCPSLRREAYEGSLLKAQMEEQARLFIKDPFRNHLRPGDAQLSKIFDWFSGDFEEVMPVRDFINQYAEVKITSQTRVSYKEYDWRLNEQH